MAPPRRISPWLRSRRFIAQVHLWTGVALSLYVIVLCLTGSLIVLRPQIHRWLDHSAGPVLQAVEWLVDLHDNLLSGMTGRTINGAAGVLFTLLAITGLVIWWPGRSRWTAALVPGTPAKSRRFVRQLHLSTGFWISALLLVWSTTAVYFAFPEGFAAVSDEFMAAFVRLHFGRFGGYTGRIAWMVLGLVPLGLAITGLILWWPRIRPRTTASSG